jgi:hypothetical protein
MNDCNCLPENGNVVIDDRVFRSRRFQFEQNSGFFGASKFGFVNIIPTIAFVVLAKVMKLEISLQELSLIDFYEAF